MAVHLDVSTNKQCEHGLDGYCPACELLNSCREDAQLDAREYWLERSELTEGQ